jgi:hypothetical protein
VIYRALAHNLVEGDGFSLPGVDSPALEPSAEHPPVFPVVLAGLEVLGLDGPGEQRIALATLAAAGVLLVIVLGRRLAGPLAGLVAGGIAAVHPLWIQHPGLLMSEAVHLVIVPGVLLAAVAVLDRPSWRRAALLGGLAGLAGLVRAEAVGLVLLVGLPAAVLAAGGWRARARWAGLVLLGAAVVVGPWLLRNQRELDTLTMSTNSGKTLMGANCVDTFSGPKLGGFSYDCQFGAAALVVQAGLPPGEPDAVAVDRVLGDLARQFIDDHRRQLPKVMAARGLRLWGLAFVEDQRRFDVGESRDPALQRAGQWVHLALLPLAAAGAVGLARRRDRRLVVLLGPLVLVTVTAVLVYGGTRLRAGAEPSLAVLAGVGAAALAARMSRRGAASGRAGNPGVRDARR